MNISSWKATVLSVFVLVLCAVPCQAGFSGTAPSPGNGASQHDKGPGIKDERTRVNDPRNAEKSKKYRDGELIVKFRLEIPMASKVKLHQRHGSQVIKEFPGLGLNHVKLKKGVTVEEAVKRYRAEPEVEYAEPNYSYTIQALPDDPRFPELWALRNTGQTGGTANADINATGAWNTTTGSGSVVVAVLDTGVDHSHADLTANLWRNPWETAGNGSDDDLNGYVDDVYGIDPINLDSNPWDDHGHGTHVAGTIGATGSNGTGVVGVNWSVRIMPCKFLDAGGSGSTDGAVACLQYIKAMKDKGVNVAAVSNSWGGNGYSQALFDAIQALPDVLFIAAAGNNGLNNDRSDVYPANYQLPNVIAVAATDHNDDLAFFSDYGRNSVQVGAPGVDILSTLPASNYWGITGGYGLLSGTSMATPHVSGLAALLKAQNPGRDWKSIKNLILAGGDTVAALDGKTLTGKRINASGSVNCSNRPLLTVRGLPTMLTPSVPVTFSVLSINCGSAQGPVVVTASGGETITLSDDGTGVDQAAYDGVFTGTWTPVAEGEELEISSPAGALSLPVPQLRIYRHLPEANVRAGYRHGLDGRGGSKPYTWAIISGQLPPGLNLEGPGGIISGTPAAMGIFNFTVQMTDAEGHVLSSPLTLTVTDDNVLETSTKSYDSGDFDLGQAIALDTEGNYYLAATSLVPSGKGYDAVVGKYDAAGELVWSRTYSTPSDDRPRDVKVDQSGNVYLAGSSADWIQWSSSWFVIKYDSAGNLLWSKTYHSSDEDHLGAIAVDPSGNVYATGSRNLWFTPTRNWDARIVTVKYDPSGNLIWERVSDHSDSFTDGHDYSSGVAFDTNGNIYVGGGTGWRGAPDPNCSASNNQMIKYDPLGGELWANTLAQAHISVCTPAEAMGTRGGIGVDGAGNVYLTGSPSPVLADGCTTTKYDPAGNIVWQRTYSNPDIGNHIIQCNGIAVDAAGNSFIAISKGTYTGGWTYYFSVIKYNPNGTLVWEKHLDAGHEPISSYGVAGAFGIALGGSGDIHATGHTFNGTDFDTLTVTLRDITEELTIHPVPLSTGAVGVAYSQTLEASGGAPPYTWSIVSGILPWGLTCAGSTGTISGTPTTAGLYSFSVGVADSLQASASKPFSIYVPTPGCLSAPVRVSGAAPGNFPDFASAYAQAAENDAVLLQAVEYGGDFTLDRNIRSALKGGYDCGFGASAATSKLLGTLRVLDGTVAIGNLNFK